MIFREFAESLKISPRVTQRALRKKDYIKCYKKPRRVSQPFGDRVEPSIHLKNIKDLVLWDE